MILDVAETVLKFLGFDRTVYEKPVDKRKKKKWYEELHSQCLMHFKLLYSRRIFMPPFVLTSL
jgi:hypothetical protein